MRKRFLLKELADFICQTRGGTHEQIRQALGLTPRQYSDSICRKHDLKVEYVHKLNVHFPEVMEEFLLEKTCRRADLYGLDMKKFLRKRIDCND